MTRYVVVTKTPTPRLGVALEILPVVGTEAA